MKDSDFLDLANRVIDGVGSEHDRAALEAVMHDSTQRRLEFDQLAALASILNAVRPVDPPADLRERILSSLPLKAETEPVSWVSRVRDSVVDTIRARPRGSLAYAVVAGLMVGAIGVGMLSGQLDSDETALVGTMSAPAAASVVDESVASAGTATVTGSLSAEADQFTVSLTVESALPAELVVSALEGFDSWTVIRLPESPASSVKIDRSGVHLRDVTAGTVVLNGRRHGDLEVAVQITSGEDHDGLMTLKMPN